MNEIKPTSKQIKTRFAPSPTGFMHFGNVRTALFNYLFAKHHHGTFLLRIEDTDLARSEGVFRDAIQQDLEWLDILWDEGPFYQSERQSIYDEFYTKLEEWGFTYPCFCSEAQLALTRKVQLSSGQPPRYPGTCRNLSQEDIAIKKAEGIPWTLRFQVPKGENVEFNDLIKGPCRFETDNIGDFIIRRHDGSASFMYCNAVDDALMGVTHALRGDDHLTNTPRQILILHALKLAVPQYGHFPTILGPDSRPLSKRNGSRSLQELRAEGYLPAGILNYLARLGHYDPDMHLCSLEELCQHFDVEHISKSPAHFDAHQLHFWQKEAMHQASFEEAWGLISHYVQGFVPEGQERNFLEVIQANVVMPKEALFWARCFFTEDWSYAEYADSEDLALIETAVKAAGQEFYKKSLETFNRHPDPKEFLRQLQQNTQLKGKSLFMPLRAALTAALHGPELPKIIQILGSDKVIERFTKAVDYA